MILCVWSYLAASLLQNRSHVKYEIILYETQCLALQFNLATVAAARLAKDTTVDSSSAALMTKDGSETVGTKALAGMQVSVSNGCANVEELAEAYNTVKSGSIVSMVSTTSTPGTRELYSLEEGMVSEGGISEHTDAVSTASLSGNNLCLGSTCFILGTPCRGDNSNNSRRLERVIAQKDVFLRAMKDRLSNHGTLRKNMHRALLPDPPEDVCSNPDSDEDFDCCEHRECMCGRAEDCTGCDNCVQEN